MYPSYGDGMARGDTDQRPILPMPQGLLAPQVLRQGVVPQKPDESITVNVVGDGPPDGVSIDPETGATSMELGDGSVLIDLEPPLVKRNMSGARVHNANLAEYIAESELSRISQDLIRAIGVDDQSRSEWLETRAKGIRLLGLKIEAPRSGADASAAVEGQSTVQHPLLLESTLRFQANARGELLPAAGPVKVADKLLETGENDELAEALEDDLNYYLVNTATEYYPDSDRMLFYVGFGGCGFKKVYNCPIRQRPVSESVDAKDLIVSDASTDLRNSGRVTHVIRMRPSVMKRMQLAGAYRDVKLSTPNSPTMNPVDLQIADTQGVDPNTQQVSEDRDHTVYEVYCELDIKGFEHTDKSGEETGLPLPYRVVIEKDSREILEVRRNWAEDDESRLAKICFVKYPFVPGLGFYDIGFIHILGNTTNALTAAWRELIDMGMFANFPGFLIAKSAARQNSNQMRVSPGSGIPVETNGMDIQKAIMAVPYKDIGATFVQFIEQIADTGQRVGGTAEIKIGEGSQDAPVGTTLALIEQATKIMDAVHKRLHAAQTEEFQLLKECFRENPGAFIRSAGKKGKVVWDEQKFIAALESADIVPQADPNTPSHMHRLMKAMALKQLQAASPGLYDAKAVDERVLRMIGFNDVDALFNKNPQQQQPDPALMVKAQELAQKPQLLAAKAQMDQANLAGKMALQQAESQDQQADRDNRLQIARMGLVSDALSHHSEANSQTNQIAELKAENAEDRADHRADAAKHAEALAKAKAAAAAKAKPAAAKKK